MDATTLQKLVTEVAKKELREDESTREQAVEQFRDWIEKNPDIRDCRTDDTFLLMLLRKSKFSVPMAQQVLLRLADFYEASAHLARFPDFKDPKVNEFATNGYVFASPFRDDLGRKIIINQTYRYDPAKCDFSDHIRAFLATIMTAAENEATQVLGSVFIVDIAKATAAHITHAPISEVLDLLKASQNCIPMRFKAIHFLNVQAIFRWILDFIVSHSSNKMTHRFFIHESIEDLHKHVNPSILPAEYGGKMPMKEMIDLWQIELESKRDLVLASANTRVVRPHDTDLKTNMAALPGSFRKLDVD